MYVWLGYQGQLTIVGGSSYYRSAQCCLCPGLCRQQQKRLTAAVEKAWENGILNHVATLRHTLSQLLALCITVEPR